MPAPASTPSGLLTFPIRVSRPSRSADKLFAGADLRPLMLPGIATAALQAFLFSWTELIGALSFMTNDSLFRRT
jgi:type IV secretory pathway TrbD component